jgi:alpha-tubulin suppressor-like RCC1 family protein
MYAAGTRRLAAVVASPMTFALLVLLACGDGSGPGDADGIAQVVVDAVDPDGSGAVVVQDSVQLAVVLLDSAGQALPAQPVAWRSSDPALGTVSATGLVHGVKAGRITITAAVGRDTGSYVTDVLPLAHTLELVPGHLGMVPGGVYDLSVIFRDSTGAQLQPEGRHVVWSNPTPEFAGLDGGINARVTAVASGSAMLTATGSGASAYIGVDVETPHFFSVVAGDRQSCGHTSFFVVYCWGSNVGNMLGAPIGTSSVAPLLVEGLGSEMKAVVPGNGHICALSQDGDAWCWGNGTVGQLGDGSSGATNEGIVPPRQTSGGLHFQSLALGDGFTCGLTTDDAAYCWGAGNEGALGNGTSAGIAATPVPVSGGLTFTELRSHPIGRTVCGVAVAGTVWCWGRNANGQVGDGTTDERTVPTIVPGPLLLYGVAVGARHTCALDPSGTAYCWGDNELGQLGQAGEHLEPSPVDGDLEFINLTAGTAYTCGTVASGEAYCWGDNERGQLGNGTTTPSASPVLVSGGLTFARLSAGNDHTCGRTSTQVAYCWGSAEAVGSPVDQFTAVPVKVLGQEWGAP